MVHLNRGFECAITAPGAGLFPVPFSFVFFREKMFFHAHDPALLVSPTVTVPEAAMVIYEIVPDPAAVLNPASYVFRFPVAGTVSFHAGGFPADPGH